MHEAQCQMHMQNENAECTMHVVMATACMFQWAWCIS
jgi:hypothetical protein